MNEQWYTMGYERVPWQSSLDFTYISKRQRDKIKEDYLAAVPLKIASIGIDLTNEIQLLLDEVLVAIIRFDAIQQEKKYSFPALLLRSESAASSQIENLTSSVRNIALAELNVKAPHNAKLILGNVKAMREAIKSDSDIDKDVIKEIHKTLIEPSGADFGGHFRDEQVWIGGSSHSPHDALFVPPIANRINEYLDDIISFSKREDLNPIVKTALFHAQFETIHPFVDGNGRTGRTLIHRMLKSEQILLSVTLPVSSGLLANIENYMSAIKEYQNGNPLPIIVQISEALKLAVSIGTKVSQKIDKTLDTWMATIDQRRNKNLVNLLYLLVENPVVNSQLISKKMDISLRTANNLLNKAKEYQIIRQVGTEKRGIYYQSDEIISIFDEISDAKGLYRLFS
ncbi:MAG: Fic family protein [Clostridiales Family XIII bacterium]|jgi:Fic family protein|nr:Fic family protein [Clostridiales Family XIII bacterium]